MKINRKEIIVLKLIKQYRFCDGNGRIGRLLITLYLISQGLLAKSSLYLSDYFEKHKGSYYDALTMARVSNDLLHWIKFFLVAIIEIANKGTQTFQNILALSREVEYKLLDFGKKAKNAKKLLQRLYSKPSISVNEVATLLDITHQAANVLIKDFESHGILMEATGYQRNRLYIFERYLKLFLA